MNEASSRYVDQIATQKLISEKLSRVHHAPGGEEAWLSDDLDFLVDAPPTVTSMQMLPGTDGTVYAFPSALQTPYVENDTVRCRYHPAENALGAIIFVHGLYEDNLRIYDFFIRMLNEHGLSVYLLILPYHYERRPAQSAFSGEYFWSADVGRSAQAYQQAVLDLRHLYGYVKRMHQGPVWIVGFSMGGGVALTLSTLAPLDGVFSVNPVCNLTDLVWRRPLFATIKSDLEAHGVQLEDLTKRYRSYDPLESGPGATPTSRIVLARGVYDEINSPANYGLLVAKWRLDEVLEYRAGHLNILRVPKLAADVARYRARAQETALMAPSSELRGAR